MNQTWQCTQHTTKMLASTIQISNNNPTPPRPHPPGEDRNRPGSLRTAARTEAPDTPPATGRTPDSSEPQQCAPTHRTHTEPATQDRPTTHDHPDPGNTGTGPGNTGTGRGMSMIPLVNTTTIGATRTATHRGVGSLERGFPSPTFRYGYLVTTSSQSPAPPSTTPPSKLVGPWASGVADFRDVTGGVYKARERIHRSVADLRLLATPTSWGRVADPNPN